MHGISVEEIEAFIFKYCGGRENILGLTTTDICNQYLKPATHEHEASYCEYLNASHGITNNDVEENKACRKASVFISHAWKYKFVEWMH